MHGTSVTTAKPRLARPVGSVHVLMLSAVLAVIATSCDPDSQTESDTAEDIASLDGERGWTPVLVDDFDGIALDRTRWATAYRWGGRSLPQNNHQQCFRDQNVTVAGGFAILQARIEQATCDGRTVPYTSGIISAHPSMNQAFGYFEIRVKVPRGNGLWSSFWTLPHPVPNGRVEEIDGFEILGKLPSRANMNVHWQRDAPSASTAYDQCAACGPDFASGFHTFAVQWERTSITWYIDGIERKRFLATIAGSYIPERPAYLMADLALGGWAGIPDASTVFPVQLEIDFIKSLKRINSAGANPNRIVNESFESDLSSWGAYGGASLSAQARTGTRSIRIVGQGGTYQDLTGLRPHTAYRLRGFVRSATATTAMIGVKDHGAPQLQNYWSASTWGVVSLVFSTGNTTTARIFTYQSAPGAEAFFDDFSLQAL
jgi:beta-glucanase (GH16 family)